MDKDQMELNSQSETKGVLRIRSGLSTKLFTLFLLLGLSLIPRWYAADIIQERQGYESEAVRSIATGWAAYNKLG